MTTRCNQILPADSTAKPTRNFKRNWPFGWFVLALLLAACSSAQAEEPDAKYMRSYYAIEQADSLAKRGQTEAAKAKYQAAQAALKDLKNISPTWNTKAVAYRLSYVNERIESLSQPPAPAATEVAGDAKATAQSGALAPGTEVKLLSAGAEPRQALRLQVKSGETQKAVMTLQMAMSMGGAGELMKIPAIKMDLDAEIKGVNAGDINCETRLGDVGIESEAGSAPQLVDAMKASFGNLKGMVIVSTISDRGSSKKAEVKLPPGADASARQSMEQMKESFLNSQVVLPEEPVGPDAKWEVKQKIKSQGMTIDQTTTHHLVSMEGNVLNIESSIEQSAANQKVANPAMPQLKVDLTKMTGKSKGQLTVDLTKVLPTAATINGGAEMVMSAGAGAQAQSMTMKMGANIKIESK